MNRSHVSPTLVALVLVLSATGGAAEEQASSSESTELKWRDPVKKYSPDDLCTGDCMLDYSHDEVWVQDDAEAITSFGNPGTRPKKHIPPLFHLLRDLFKGEKP